MAPPADEYATPSSGAGRLKLKGSSSSSSSKPQDGNRVDKNKNKKKKDKKSRKDRTDKEGGETTSSPPPSFARPRGRDGVGDSGASNGSGDDGTEDRDRDRRDVSEGGAEEDTVAVGKTEAEKRYDEARRRRLNERLKREGVKSHKERVEELNQYLSNLSEHHDMPKIGPG